MSGDGASDGQDKNFDPTPGRLEKARREGDIALSREANAAASYGGLYLAIVAGAGGACAALAPILSRFYAFPEDYMPGGGSAAGLVAASTAKAAAAAAVFFAAPAVLVLLSIIAQRGLVFAPTKLAPKWSRLSLINNAKHKFGPQGLGEFAISAVKLFGVLALFASIFLGRFMDLPAAALLPATAILPALQREAVLFVGAILIFSVAAAALDLVRVRAGHRKRLMMTLEEVRQESKENEGDPHFKQARRERAKAIATNRMLLDVPAASVVIVNPTHYAVALKWDGPKSGAPQCVAKGVDEMATKIRELAAANGVPIRRDAPTARAIYGAVEVGEEIRREHYVAVAAAIHFADRIRAETRAR